MSSSVFFGLRRSSEGGRSIVSEAGPKWSHAFPESSTVMSGFEQGVQRGEDYAASETVHSELSGRCCGSVCRLRRAVACCWTSAAVRPRGDTPGSACGREARQSGGRACSRHFRRSCGCGEGRAAGKVRAQRSAASGAGPHPGVRQTRHRCTGHRCQRLLVVSGGSRSSGKDRANARRGPFEVVRGASGPLRGAHFAGAAVSRSGGGTTGTCREAVGDARSGHRRARER